MRHQAQADAAGKVQDRAQRKLVLAVLRCRAKKRGRMVEIRRQRKQVLIAEPSRKIAAEAGVGVGKLQAAAYELRAPDW